MSTTPKTDKQFWKRGEQYVWLSGAALGFTLLIALTLLVVVVKSGLGVFWPSEVTGYTLTDGSKIQGELMQRELMPQEDDYTGPDQYRIQLKTGNRELYDLDFRWIPEAEIAESYVPERIYVFERMEHGNFYGYIKAINTPETGEVTGQAAEHRLPRRRAQAAAGDVALHRPLSRRARPQRRGRSE